VDESRRARLTPVFTYYMLLQSDPSRGGAEDAHDLANLNDPGLMKAYYQDFALLLTRARGSGALVHVEPDLWGYVQQHARADDAASVPAAVAASGDERLRGLPDTAAGFAQALVRLRDAIAPDVRLAVHMSMWGTKVDPVLQNPSLREVDALAARSSAFIRSLGARFDAVFSDPSDRDDGFKLKNYGDHGAGRWTRGDYRRDIRWVGDVHRTLHLPMAEWQIPLGNRRLPNTWGRYRDTHVQTLLGDRRILKAYRNAGVVALLFGGGADGTTSERTDHGLFARLARRYAHARLHTQ
jgi:hypothetical protein